MRAGQNKVCIFYAADAFFENSNVFQARRGREKKWSFLFSRCNGDKMELQTRVFREKASEICRTHDYIYDLSHIFDGEDVYIDHCHVFEHGNEIIAREIYNIIKELM